MISSKVNSHLGPMENHGVNHTLTSVGISVFFFYFRIQMPTRFASVLTISPNAFVSPRILFYFLLLHFIFNGRILNKVTDRCDEFLCHHPSLSLWVQMSFWGVISFPNFFQTGLTIDNKLSYSLDASQVNDNLVCILFSQLHILLLFLLMRNLINISL